MPADHRSAMGAAVYGCDVCQDVCPWNRGVERRRRDAALPTDAQPTVSLRAWLDPEVDVAHAFDRLYVPGNDSRWLRRNALVALGNTGTVEDEALLRPWEESTDAMLAETAGWARERLAERRE
jgi:epoxyqueuosine reductase